MGKFELRSGARLAAAAGLGLTLALGAAPVVAMATEDNPIADSQVNSSDTSADETGPGEGVVDEGDDDVVEGDGTESNPYVALSSTDLQYAFDKGGYVKIGRSFAIAEYPTNDDYHLSVPQGKTIVLDLNGNTVGMFAELTESGNNGFLENLGTLTIVDSVGDNSYGGIINATVNNVGTMTLDGITVSCPNGYGIQNQGTLTVTNCDLSGSYPLRTSGKDVSNQVVTNVSNTSITAGKLGEGQSFYGVTVLGNGLNEDGSYNNDHVVVSLNNCEIKSPEVGGLGICTNASSGTYAGFTISATDTVVNLGDAEADGCALYLPGIGVTSLSGCTVTGAQGIRIAAGEINVRDNTTVNGTAPMGTGDLVPGGNGGTLGALVVGKASAGYVGDVRVYVDSTSSLNNTATEGEGVVAPAVVVSDKNMASSAYEENTIDVVVEGDVTGDVVKTSTIDSSVGSLGGDGGSTNLEILDAKIAGNVINKSETGISLNRVTVTGNVDNENGSTGILNSTVSGIVTNGSDADAKVTIAGSQVAALGESTEGMVIVDSKVGDSDYEDKGDAVALLNGTPCENLAAALNSARPGDVVYMIRDVDSSTQVSIPAGVTLDGNGNELSCTADIVSGGFVNITSDGVSLVNLTVHTNGHAKHGVQFYCANGGFLGNVVVNGGYWTSVLVNGSDVTLDSCTLNPIATSTETPYANIEYAMGSGVEDVPSITLNANTHGTDDYPLVYADEATLARAIKVTLDEGEQLTADQRAEAVKTINANLEGAQLYLKSDGTATSDRPSTPSNPGGSVSSGEQVKVSETDGGTVKVDPTRADEGDEVTVTATPDEGQEVREVTVTDEYGKAVAVEAGEKDGEFVFTMPDGAVTVTVTFGCDGGELCPTHGFADVDQGAWYHDAIDWAVENGVLNGYGDGGTTLGPVADVTRAEMAQMLWNRAGRPEATADLSAFTDVASDGWYAPALEWCVSEGIFSGYGDTFGTERTISREEAATVLWRLAGSPEADADLSGYGDASKVSDYATGAIEWAVSEGVLTGKGDVALDPQAGCTRGEVAAMMMRMAK